MQKSSWYDLAVIVIVGVILADFVGGFYGPLGGGSGVIVSGIANLWKTSVKAMLGIAPATTASQPKGPNPPASQKKPNPPPKKKSGGPPSFPAPTSCCCGFEPFCIMHSPACCTIP